MKRIICNLVIAVPLATVGLTVVTTGGAIAGPNGPVVIGQPKNDPQPPKPDFPIAIPDKPKGPQDKAPLPKPQKPQDKAPKPAAKPQPQGGSGTAAPADAVKTEKKVAEVISTKGSPDSIDRSEGLLADDAFETELVVAEDTAGGLGITWLLVGGGIVTASGLAFAARKRTNA